MQQSPHKIAQSGTVPETAKPHHNHQVQIGSEAAMAIAAQRDIKIGPQPARQRHVPARPEFRKRAGAIWKIEVDRQPIAKEQRKAYGDCRITEEIRHRFDSCTGTPATTGPASGASHRAETPYRRSSR